MHKKPVIQKKPVFNRSVLGGAIALALFPMAAHTSPLFVERSGPPPGFSDADLNVKQSTVVGVYLGDQWLGNFHVVYDRDHLWFKSPSEELKIGGKNSTALRLVDQSGVVLPKYKSLIVKRLQSKVGFKLNQDHLCHNSDQSDSGKLFCKPLNPKVIGLIMNPSNFSVYLFINPKYLITRKVNQHNLPPSTAGFSLVNSFDLNSTRNDGTTNTSLENNTYLAYKNFKIFLDSNITHVNQDGQPNINVFSASNLYMSASSGDVNYKAGVMQTSGNNLLGAQGFLGVSIDNQYIPGTRNSGLSASPLIVYLASKSIVSVYQNNMLIYTATLAAGKQQIDTTTFPEGSYGIKVKITGLQGGKSRVISSFFSKQADMPLEGIRYGFYAGFLQKDQYWFDNTNEDTHFQHPSFMYKPIMEYDVQKGINSHFGLSLMGLTNYQEYYGSLGTTYYGALGGNSYSITPGVVVSNGHGYGFNSQADYNGSFYSFTGSVTKLYDYNQNYQYQLIGSSPAQSFDPLQIDGFQSAIKGKLYLGSFNLSSGYNVSRDESGNLINGYAVDLSRPIYQGGDVNSSVDVQYNNSYGIKTLRLSMDIMLSTTYLTSEFSGMYDKYYEGSSNSGNSEELSGDVNLSTNYQFADSSSVSASLSAGHDSGYKTYQANLQYQSQNMSGNFDFSRDYYDNVFQDTYTGSLQSSFMYAGHHASYGYGGNDYTGILVHVHSPKKVKYRVFVDDEPVGDNYSDNNTSIFLQPFKTYRVRVDSLGSGLFQYNHNFKQVTLYEGNVQSLNWNFAKQVVLFAKVVDNQGQGMPNLLLMQNASFDTTDDAGYLQASIISTRKKIKLFSKSGQSCQVSLPKLDSDKKIIVLNKPLHCHLVQDKLNSKKT